MTTPPPTGVPTALSGLGGLAHIGIRVHDLERSAAFYARLGFQFVAGPIGPEPVAILSHPSGLELNLILNAPTAAAANVLMDGPDKPAGLTHFALLCNDLDTAIKELRAVGLEPSAGPVDFGGQARGLFLRDPDRNVIELHQRL
ncbi:VOC family protein [Cyanobium sp. Morenito 9A2]|uniref:VOC family protein n=1 Tax=Cyanobium sp. Morenito 9A2 TaxID=2823718 RepID=UPI0020CC85BF|nr:VOC family protein [Cyanobium sp. Morenito 9A2]MCP9850698.1 VOC family protein [Cyanobium sp. Morenito 9A2]